MSWKLQRGRAPIIGYALDIGNPTLDFKCFGSPYEVLATVRSRHMVLKSLVNHSDTGIRAVEIFKEGPSLKFSGGPHADAILDILDCLDRSDMERLARVVTLRRQALIADDYSAAVPLLAAVATGNREAVRLIVRGGAGVDRTTHFDMTPLHWAAALGMAAVTSALLDAGANAERVSWFFVSAGELAAMNKQKETIRAMERQGINKTDPPSTKDLLYRMAAAFADAG